MTLTHPEAIRIIEDTQVQLRKLTGNDAIMLVAFYKPDTKASPLQIIEIICEYTCISMPEVRSASRRREVVTARELIIYYLKSCHGFSYKKIGEILGGRDHTTVLAANRRMQGFLDCSDEVICNAIAAINKRLEERNNADQG